MHNNYYFLRQLSSELARRLEGFSVVSCFSQNKDELIIEFNNAKQSFFLRGNFDSAFCCLSFPENFSRARKNSIDLFPEIILKKVNGIRQYENERSFSLSLGDDLQLLFKMHGNRANVVLCRGNAPSSIFRNHLQADFELIPDQLNRTIDWSKEAFLTNTDAIPSLYYTFGKPVWTWLKLNGFDAADAEKRWGMIQETRALLESPEFMIGQLPTGLALLLIPLGETVSEFKDPVKAVTEFFFSAIAVDSFQTERNAVLSQLRSKISAGENYLAKVQEKLTGVLADNHYQSWGDLLMANMHKAAPGASSITVENFYNENKLLEIKLKSTLSPQKNAEVYYRKSKNQQIEIQKLREAIGAKEKELSGHRANLALLESELTLKGLRQKMDATGLARKEAEKQPEVVPYREFECKGWKIWVGRNAESNDKLTLKFSYKEDLWLHAKDVAGSHVLLKYQAGKNFPKDVIEHAAGLAAFYSKRKNESLVPVAFTQKKYVRKRKGDPAGAVVVEREEVLLTAPIQFSNE